MVSVIPTHIAAFILSTDSALWRHYKADGAPDTAWPPAWYREVTNGIWIREFVTIKRIDGEVDIFALDVNHSLNQSNFNFLSDHGMRPWKNLGGKLVTVPAVANSKGTIHIFHIGTDHALYHNSWDGTTHTPFEKLDGIFAHTPAAVSAGEKEVSVFAVGLTDGLLHHYHWSSRSGWAPVEKIPGIWAGTPCAVSDSDGSWDVFGVDPSGNINHVSDRKPSDKYSRQDLLIDILCIITQMTARGSALKRLTAISKPSMPYLGDWEGSI